LEQERGGRRPKSKRKSKLHLQQEPKSKPQLHIQPIEKQILLLFFLLLKKPFQIAVILLAFTKQIILLLLLVKVKVPNAVSLHCAKARLSQLLGQTTNHERTETTGALPQADSKSISLLDLESSIDALPITNPVP